MLLGFWQLKITVSLLLLASCIGQELLRTCDRDYCYERAIESRNIEEDRIREWYRGERLHDNTERRNTFRDVRENPVEKSVESRRLNSHRESGAEIPRELDRLSLSRRELRADKSQRLSNEYRVMIPDSTTMPDEVRRVVISRTDSSAADRHDNYRNVDRRLDVTRRTERLTERTREEAQRSNENEREDRSATSRGLNERVDRRYNDRVSATRLDLEQRRQHEVNTLNRETRRLTERHSNRGEDSTRVERETRRTNQRVSENDIHLELSDRDEHRRLPQRDLRTLKMSERRLNERQYIADNRRSSRKDREETNRQERDSRVITDRISEQKRFSQDHGSGVNLRSTERISQRNLEKASVIEIEAENQRDNTKHDNRDSENESRFESRNLPLRELNVLERSERRLNERERLIENRRHIESPYEERNREDHDNRLERYRESRRSIERLSKTERSLDERENVRRLTENENKRSRENRVSSRLSERLDKPDQRRTQLNNDNEQEREVRERRETLRQLDNRNKRYNIDTRLNERGNVRQNRNTLDYPDTQERVSQSERNQRDLKTQEQMNLRERNVIDRNLESRRFNSQLNELEKGILQNGERLSRSSQISRKSVERRSENIRVYNERREEFLQTEERENKRDESRAFNENAASRRIDERYVVNNDKVQRHNNEQINRQSDERQNDDLMRRNVENKRVGHNERLDQRLDFTQQNRDFHYKVDKYIEKPTVFLNKTCMTVGQGALLAFIILKTLNGKNAIKYNIHQRLQEAIALMGY